MSERVGLQPKPAVAQPRIMRVPTRVLQRKCACGGSGGESGECTECKRKEMTLQRNAASHREPAAVPPIVSDVVNSPGQPLDAATRAFFEPRFGHDFSRVRVHTDPKAMQSARAVNALAYTIGRDIVLAKSESAASEHVRTLLAHELTHVLQQGQGHVSVGDNSSLRLGAPDDSNEMEASRVAREVMTLGESGELESGPSKASRSWLSVSHSLLPSPRRNPPLYIARQCLNPDICAQYKSKKECLPRNCGDGGTCLWPSITVGCCCLGARTRVPQPQEAPAREPERKTSSEEAESKLRQLLPAWVIVLLGAALLAALVACFASGVCEAGIILGGVAAAAALVIIAALRHAGVDVRGGPPTLA